MKTCIVAIAKNEDEYIEEWLNYHLQFIDYIFLICNKWNYKLSEFFKNKVIILNSDNFILADKDPSVYWQANVYNVLWHDYLYKSDIDYAAFIDIDEFITFKHENGNNKKVEFSNIIIKNDIDKMYLKWRLFGDNGISKIDNYKVIDRFTKSEKWFDTNFYGKILLRVHTQNSNKEFFTDPHQIFNLEKRSQCLVFVPNNGYQVYPNIKIVNMPSIYLSHYCVKSLEEYKKRKLNSSYKKLSNLQNCKDYESFMMENFYKQNKNDITNFDVLNLRNK